MNTTLTIATVAIYNNHYRALTEHKIRFCRPYTLTERGIQRMLSRGCPETQDEPRPECSVISVQHFVFEP